MSQLPTDALRRAREYVDGLRRRPRELPPDAPPTIEDFYRTDLNEIYRALDAILEHLEREQRK